MFSTPQICQKLPIKLQFFSFFHSNMQTLPLLLFTTRPTCLSAYIHDIIVKNLVNFQGVIFNIDVSDHYFLTVMYAPSKATKRKSICLKFTDKKSTESRPQLSRFLLVSNIWMNMTEIFFVLMFLSTYSKIFKLCY